MLDFLFRIVGIAIGIWILIWIVFHPAEVHQILGNVGQFFSSAKN